MHTNSNLQAAIWLAGVFTIITTLLTAHQVRRHLQFNSHATLRKFVIRIILMAPIYAIGSWFGLRFKHYTIYFDLLRECYEAFVIYSFYTFLVTYLGGETGLARMLPSKPAYKHGSPFCCLRPWTMGDGGADEGSFFLQTQIGTLQYVVLKTFCGVLAFIFSIAGIYGESSLDFHTAYPYISFINNCSQVWAMYCLICFYIVCKENLKPIRPLYKFMVVKAVVFFTFWQSILIIFLAKWELIGEVDTEYTENDIVAALTDFLVCLEMVIAAISHAYAFPYKELHEPSATLRAPLFRSLFEAIYIIDVGADVRTVNTRRKRRRKHHQQLQADRQSILDNDVMGGSSSASDVSDVEDDDNDSNGASSPRDRRVLPPATAMVTMQSLPAVALSPTAAPSLTITANSTTSTSSSSSSSEPLSPSQSTTSYQPL